MTETASVVFQLLQNLLLTVMIETPAALLLGVRKKRDILYVVLINCVTNPVINYAMLLVSFVFFNGGSKAVYYAFLFVFEIIVVLWEYRFFKKNLPYNKMNPLLFSLILNASSAVLGFALYLLLRSGFPRFSA